MTITSGESKPIVYELRMSAHELDVILHSITFDNSDIYADDRKELVDFFTKLQAIRSPSNIRLVKYGTMDSSRLNWQ